MALHTQNSVSVLIGDTLADLPNAQTVRLEGTLFHDRATHACRILLIKPDGTHEWQPFCCGSSGCA